jgi:hypothetical protein
MQLRVARLCLDCEELYVGSHCPVCASERYAFLSSWLPSEERRRWRRAGPRAGGASSGVLAGVRRFFSRLLGDAHADVEPANRTLRTRASDYVPNLDFDGAPQEPPKTPAAAQDSAELSPPHV